MGIEVIARGLCVRGQQVLMCKSLKGGYMYLPGGHVEVGESASAALERELLEETGLASEVGEFLIASELHFEQGGKTKHEITLLFHVERLGEGTEAPEEVPSAEGHLGFAWVDIAAVQDLDVRPSVHQAWLIAGAEERGYLFSDERQQ